jgi:hypothetical protein
MATQPKNAVELSEMIKVSVGKEDLRVGVFSTASGWYAKVYAAQNIVADLQKKVDRACQELRKLYSLEN